MLCTACAVVAMATATSLGNATNNAALQLGLAHWPNIGQCSAAASGRYGEALGERIFFLKSYKTASSTTRDVLEMFRQDLAMRPVWSTRPGGALCGPELGKWFYLRFKDTRGARPRGPGNAAETYDISDVHSCLDLAAVRKYLPNARWITLSRDPLERVRSAIAYFMQESTVDQFLRQFENGKHHFDLQKQHRIVNSVAWVNGVPASHPSIEGKTVAEVFKTFQKANLSTALRRFEETGPETFALVMLTERYEESLVLLRSVLCWRWSDILVQGPPLSVAQQSSTARRANKGIHKPVANVSRSNLKKILQLNHLDVQLHDAAKRKFSQLTEQYGGPAKLAEDVRFFRRYSFTFAAVCLTCTRGPANGAPTGLQDFNCEDFQRKCFDLSQEKRAVFPVERAVDTSDAGRADAALVKYLFACRGFREFTVHFRQANTRGELCADGARGTTLSF